MRMLKCLRSRSGVPIISGMLSVVLLLIMNSLSFAQVTEATPDEYIVTCYKTEISTNGTTWVTCFDNPAGTLIDLASPTGPGSLFGPQGEVAIGVYKHIRITIMNTITYSCTSPVVPQGGFNPYIAAADAHMPVYFSNQYGGSSWSNDGSELLRAFPLPDPINVEYNTTTKVVINFIITNSLKNNGGWSLEPPVMNVTSVVNRALEVTFTGGDYYFSRSNINIDNPFTSTVITPAWMRFSSGWGKITLTNPIENVGAFTVTAGADNTENNQQIDSSGGISGTINTPEIYIGSADMTGTYYIDPTGYINMLMPESGIIRGAVSDDGRVFIAIETGVPDSYHMIYAIKKEDQIPRDLSGKSIFSMYETQLTTTVDETTTPYPQGYRLAYGTSIGMANLDPASNTISPSGTGVRVEIERPLSTTQNVLSPVSDQYNDTNSGKVNPDAFGVWNLTTGGSGSNMRGYMLSDDSVSLICGSTITNTGVYTYTDGANTITATVNTLQFGVSLPPILAVSSLAIADINGSYTVVYRGDMVRQESGVTKTAFWVLLGRFTFDGNGNVSGSMTRCERGAVETETFSGQYQIADETIGSGTENISVKVVRLYDPTDPDPVKADPRNGPRLILTPNKKVAMIYQPVTIWVDPDGPGGSPETEIVNDERGLGLAVKHR
ncbi:MAG: hypothetical protein AB1599_01860 [Planctomycetota bacterium]